jgi:Flp pilus assembly pilin Flp
MFEHFTSFLCDEDGAVTVDWVVLTAMAAFIAVGIAAALGSASNDLAQRISDRIDLVP